MKIESGIKKIVLLFITILAVMSIYTAAGMLLSGLEIGNIYPLFLAELVISSGAVAVAILFGMKDKMKFTTKGMGTGFVCSIYPVLIIVWGFIAILIRNKGNIEISVSASEVIILIITSLMIGFAEELLFRGTLLNCLFDLFGENNRKSVCKAITCSALIFGCAHITNMIKVQLSAAH